MRMVITQGGVERALERVLPDLPETQINRVFDALYKERKIFDSGADMEHWDEVGAD